MFGWDDLRLVLAIARATNLTAAANAMGVSHSTVFRRLNSLEARLASKMFERLASGYRLTESGTQVVQAAERIEHEALALEREIAGRDTHLSGRLRVTCSETLALRFVTAELARFRRAHPGIVVDLLVENRMLDLTRRETDVALRAERPKRGDFIGRKLSSIHWALYASPSYLKTVLVPRRVHDLQHHSIIGWADLPPPMKVVAWIEEKVRPASIQFRSNSLVNQMNAAEEGLGVAVLPMYLVADNPNLIRIQGPLKELVTELWIITHRSLRNTARVRTFMEFVGQRIKRRMATYDR